MKQRDSFKNYEDEQESDLPSPTRRSFLRKAGAAAIAGGAMGLVAGQAPGDVKAQETPQDSIGPLKPRQRRNQA